MKQVFRTSDGQEFTNEEAANRHEAIIAARGVYKTAQRELHALLVNELVTADGQPFGFGSLRDYFFIVQPEWGGHYIKKVTFSYWNFAVDERGPTIIDTHWRDGKMQHYRIDELYADFDNAKQALLADFDKYVVLARKKIEDMGRPY